MNPTAHKITCVILVLLSAIPAEHKPTTSTAGTKPELVGHAIDSTKGSGREIHTRGVLDKAIVPHNDNVSVMQPNSNNMVRQTGQLGIVADYQTKVISQSFIQISIECIRVRVINDLQLCHLSHYLSSSMLSTCRWSVPGYPQPLSTAGRRGPPPTYGHAHHEHPAKQTQDAR